MALVQQATAVAVTSGSCAITLNGVTAGNTLISTGSTDAAVTFSAPTDSNGSQTWTIRVQSGSGSNAESTAIAYLLNANSGTHTVTWAALSGHTQVATLIEVSGISAVGGTGQASSIAPATTITTASYTPGSSSEFIVAAFSETGTNSSDQLQCKTSGFQSLGSVTDFGGQNCIGIYQNGTSTNTVEANAQIVTSSSAVTCTWTWTPSAAASYAICGFTYSGGGIPIGWYS